MPGILYIVATPIGNLEDITLRAIKILNDVDIVLAEDTRITRKLLSSLNDKLQITNAQLENGTGSSNLQPAIYNQQLLSYNAKAMPRAPYRPQIISYHQHTDERRFLEILNLLIEGKNIALVTDAGTPGISDPGNELIDYLVKYLSELKIIPIPGPSALTSALSVSGFNTSKLLFLGFLPKKKLNKLFEWLKQSKISFVFYESPFRIFKTLDLLDKYFPGQRVFVAREMTKMYETLYRGTVVEVREKLQKERVRGEIVVVVEAK